VETIEIHPNYIWRGAIRIELGLLSIEACEDLERLGAGQKPYKKSIENLSNVLKEENYSIFWENRDAFSNAYSEIYDVELKSEEEIKKYAHQIADRLNLAPRLIKPELQKLKNFCWRLSDHYSFVKEEIKAWEKGVYLLAS